MGLGIRQCVTGRSNGFSKGITYQNQVFSLSPLDQNVRIIPVSPQSLFLSALFFHRASRMPLGAMFAYLCRMFCIPPRFLFSLFPGPVQTMHHSVLPPFSAIFLSLSLIRTWPCFWPLFRGLFTTGMHVRQFSAELTLCTKWTPMLRNIRANLG